MIQIDHEEGIYEAYVTSAFNGVEYVNRSKSLTFLLEWAAVNTNLAYAHGEKRITIGCWEKLP